MALPASLYRKGAMESLRFALKASFLSPFLCVLRPKHGHRSFSYSAPSVWKSVPREIRHIQSTTAFKTALKTHLLKPITASKSSTDHHHPSPTPAQLVLKVRNTGFMCCARVCVCVCARGRVLCERVRARVYVCVISVLPV